MNKAMRLGQKGTAYLFDFFSSIKLAVIIIVSLAVFLAYGTFYEAAHGTAMAQKMVYHSWPANLIMILLVANLSCAAIDRLPWGKHHIGFVLTHLGIITMILGAFITQQSGLDGILYLGLNESGKYFSVEDTELRIYQSFDSRPFALLHSESVDFDRKKPNGSNYVFKLVDDDVLKITHYYQKAKRKTEVTDAAQDKGALPAFKFQMKNDRVNVEEWLGLNPELPPFYDFGPAIVTFIRGKIPKPPEPKNQIVIAQDEVTGKINYAIFSRKSLTPTSQGPVIEGKPIETGWMGLKFTVQKFIPHSKVAVTYEPLEHDSPVGGPVIEAQIGPRKSYFELDSPHDMQGDKTRYFVSFVRKRYDLGFKINLRKFKLGTYGGSNLPSNYESTVTLNENPTQHVISMNEPLKENGFTLYQSSYEQNERGEPIASVLSVNYDPGRKVKYTGAICLVLGIATMFYWKPRWTRKAK